MFGHNDTGGRMNYKKMIPFINAENEASHSVVELAERYALDGADELYVFMFSANEKEREEFYSLLRQIAKRIDIPFQAGLRVGRLEDAKKAFYTGADRIVLRSGQMPDKDVLDEVVGRFGVERVWMELDEKEFVGEEGFPVANLLLKHVNVGDELVGWLKAANAAVWIRDGLIRNDLEELLGLPGVNGVVTNYFEGKDIRKAKRSLREKGVPVFTLQSLVDFEGGGRPRLRSGSGLSNRRGVDARLYERGVVCADLGRRAHDVLQQEQEGIVAQRGHLGTFSICEGDVRGLRQGRHPCQSGASGGRLPYGGEDLLPHGVGADGVQGSLAWGDIGEGVRRDKGSEAASQGRFVYQLFI